MAVLLTSPNPGGSPYNIARGAGRLGTPTAFLGRISHDDFGQLPRRHLAESKLSLECVEEGPDLTAREELAWPKAQSRYCSSETCSSQSVLTPSTAACMARWIMA